MAEGQLTHLDQAGRARMVDIAGKQATRRRAVARGRLRMQSATLAAIMDGTVPKGDVLAVARVAGIMAAKRTGDLIPLCHPLPLTSTQVNFVPRPAPTAGSEAADAAESVLEVEAVVETVDRTGVEMEALVAVTMAALAVYDMCKAIDREMVVDAVRLVHKSGGRSGDFVRSGEERP